MLSVACIISSGILREALSLVCQRQGRKERSPKEALDNYSASPGILWADAILPTGHVGVVSRERGNLE